MPAFEFNSSGIYTLDIAPETLRSRVLRYCAIAAMVLVLGAVLVASAVLIGPALTAGIFLGGLVLGVLLGS